VDLSIIILLIVASLFSSSVMLYISLATPIGPWIAPTLALAILLISKLFFVRKTALTQTLVIATAGGSIGGIVATAVGFSFPTLHFLNPMLFKQLLATPIYFIALLGSLIFVAGTFAYLLVSLLDERLINDESLPFPIGQMTYKLITMADVTKKSMQLIAGLAATSIFTLFQTGIYSFEGIGYTCSIFAPHALGFIMIPALQIRLDTLPMLLAIGFITGHVIALSLAVGLLSKIIFVDPCNRFFFSYLNNEFFLLSFCSGIVFIGMLESFFDLIKSFRNKKINLGLPSGFSLNKVFFNAFNCIALFVIAIVLFLLRFSLPAQLYLLATTLCCVYNIVHIAGRIGLAPLGRFATFVMVPAILIFGADPLLVTFIATFVEISCGVAVDLLFGRKMASLAGISMDDVRKYQAIGLISSCFFVAINFYFLAHYFGLGSDLLVAQRAQARALLVNIPSFNWYVVGIGIGFGLFLKKIRVNTVMVLGGLLMSPIICVALILGGVLAKLTRSRAEWEPFWSGVFASNSIIELLKSIV
jgi:hypothetical protein